MVETLAVLFLIGVGLTLGWSVVASGLRAARLRAATRRMALLVRWMQGEAVRRRRHVGIVFRRGSEGSLVFGLYQDGDGDGIQTRDLREGRDTRFRGPFVLAREFPGIRFGVLPEVTLPRIPPGRGILQVGSDPIRFGPADIISFSPRGRSGSGTLYLTDGRDRIMAVVVYGPTVRIRVWRFRAVDGRWER